MSKENQEPKEAATPKLRYQVAVGNKIVKRTSDIDEANKKVEELKSQNEREFELRDTETGSLTTFYKETHQKNYRTTIGKVESAKKV